ncbi:tyrosine-type recombinase/integrase [Undibacterium sp. MH2W]|uniref:tyrosine-type recombinase/integrase n=1 Tax=Undibacterium sp. MH2W TaxID=3413044 RepID=UPI003BF433C0
MKLTAKAVQAAKSEDKAYKMADGAGLYLFVTPAGAKVWRTNYTESGKQKTATYGQFPEMGLAEARMANLSRKHAAVEEVKKVPTFEDVARRWFEIKLPDLSNEKHKKQIPSTLEEYVFPFIGNKPINEISRTELVTVVQKLSHIPETSHRVAGRIRMIFDYAQDIGVLETHGAAGLTRVLPSRKVKKPMASISTSEVGPLLAAIETYEEPVTRLALRFIAHTFVRSTELRGMLWSEINFDEKVWVIPADRMKLRIPHVVPLTPQALAILDELKQYSSGAGVVIESPLRPGYTVSENTLLFALYRLGYRGKMTVHGFRALASTVLNQQPQFHADVIERQLSHQEKDEVRAAYHRAEYLPQRRELMQWWSDWLDSQCKD